MITVYGRRSSVNVQKVLWTLAELGQPFERVTVGGEFGGNNTTDYLAMNPMGLVPVLVDDGVTMFESNAIVRFLCARYGEDSLRPEEAKELAAAEQWMEWQALNVFPLIGTMFMNLVRTPPEKRDDAAVRAAAIKLQKPLAVADTHLARQPWFAGDSFTMAEIIMGSVYWRYSQLDYEKIAAPHVQNWFERLKERKGYRDWIMVPFGHNPEEWTQYERELK